VDAEEGGKHGGCGVATARKPQHEDEDPAENDYEIMILKCP
jgi:hypothetical protein